MFMQFIHIVERVCEEMLKALGDGVNSQISLESKQYLKIPCLSYCDFLVFVHQSTGEDNSYT